MQQCYCAESNQQWSQQSLRKRKLTWKHNNQSDTGANISTQKHRRVTHAVFRRVATLITLWRGYDRSRYHTVVLTGRFADWSAEPPSTLHGGRGTGVVVGRRGSRYQTMLPVCPSVRLSDNPTPGYTIPLELNYHKFPCLLRKDWTFYSGKKNFVSVDIST